MTPLLFSFVWVSASYYFYDEISGATVEDRTPCSTRSLLNDEFIEVPPPAWFCLSRHNGLLLASFYFYKIMTLFRLATFRDVLCLSGSKLLWLLFCIYLQENWFLSNLTRMSFFHETRHTIEPQTLKFIWNNSQNGYFLLLCTPARKIYVLIRVRK